MKLKKNTTFIHRAAIMLALMLLAASTAWADGYDYIDANGVLKNTATDGIAGNDSPTVLTNSTDVSSPLDGGWYVVTDNVSYSRDVICGSDNMHLILADGAKLTVNGFSLGDGDLTIYAQSTGDGVGELSSTNYTFGISSGKGNITICGGKITASGQKAGIDADGTVTIHSGRVTASAVEEERGIYGIYANQNVILGLRNATDFINASGFSINTNLGGSISIAAGQALTDGTNTYTSATPSATLRALTNVTLTPTWEGSGTSANDPYLIKSNVQLDLLAQRVNAGNSFENTYFQLANDITYTHKAAKEEGADTENNYTAIGCHGHSFSGHFDGNGKTISGIRIYKGGSGDGDRMQGLFGYNYRAEVKNVILADARITGYTNTGGIVGLNSSSTVSGCHVGSDVSILVVQNNVSEIGGIAGGCYFPAEVSGCTSAASITTTASNTIYVGGIVGNNQKSTVSDCLYLGTTLNGDKHVGAIVGYNNASPTVKNCYYTSTSITGKDGDGYALDNASCAVGSNAGTVTITNCGLAQHTITLGSDVAFVGTTTDYTVNGTGLTGYGDFALSYNDGTTTNIYATTGATVTVNYNGGAIPANTFWKVTYIDGDYNEHDVTVTDNQNDTYSFTMPAYNVNAGVYKDFTKCTVTVPDQLYNNGYYIGYNFEGEDHGGIKVYDPEGNLLTYGTDYFYNGTESLDTDNYTDDYCTHEGEKCRVTLEGCNAWVGTKTADFEILPLSGSGTWGDLSWSFEDGTLSITLTDSEGGNKAMKSAADYNGYPWYVYRSVITTINIGEGITSIADCAFGDNQEVIVYGNATTVSLPSTLASIGNYAFAYCTGLTFNADDLIASGISIGLNAFNQVGKIIGTLSNAGDNSAMIDLMAAAAKVDVTLSGRTLIKDGDWNTLCLPFSLDADAIAASPLADATIMKLDTEHYYDASGNVYPYYNANYTQTGYDATSGTLNLYFQPATVIEDGIPYIIKWATDDNIVSPTFYDVRMTNMAYASESKDGYISFQGTFSTVGLPVEGKSNLFLGAENKLFYPNGSNANPADDNYYVNAFRAYFQLNKGLTAGETGGSQAVRGFNLNFGDEGEKTGIIELKNSRTEDMTSADAWYSLDGRKLNGKPTKKGLYINNGNMVVIK